MIFNYTATIQRDSSAFEIVAHNYDTAQLYVKFRNGSERIYDNVLESVFNLMARSDSLGRFYNQHITGKFSSTEPDGPVQLKWDQNASGLTPKPVEEKTGYEWPSLTTNTTNEPVEETSYVEQTEFTLYWESEDASYGGNVDIAAHDWETAVEEFKSVVEPAVRLGVLDPLLVKKVTIRLG